MGSPRRYGKAFLAIPADSRNAWRLNAEAFSALAFSFGALVPVPERMRGSTDQVCYRTLRQGCPKEHTCWPVRPAFALRATAVRRSLGVGGKDRPYQFGHFHPSAGRLADLKFRIRFSSKPRCGLPATTRRSPFF